jgi:hypothetical protein
VNFEVAMKAEPVHSGCFADHLDGLISADISQEVWMLEELGENQLDYTKHHCHDGPCANIPYDKRFCMEESPHKHVTATAYHVDDTTSRLGLRSLGSAEQNFEDTEMAHIGIGTWV